MPVMDRRDEGPLSEGRVSPGRRSGKSGEGEGMFSPSFRFMKVRGISIGAHWSWLAVFALISWSLSTQIFPRGYPGLGSETYLAMGIVAAVIFFASVVLHELGHSFRALKEGMTVGDITLWLFGGVARFEGMFPSAGAEFRIAIAGPIVSVILGLAFGAVAWLAEGLGLPVPVRGVADYLSRINLILVVFNMVPALPLDGGRVLRAWLWHRQRNFMAATLSAAKAGQAFGYLLIAIGVLGLFQRALTGGIWFAFLGLFLLQAAQGEVAFALMRKAFGDVDARALMTPDPVTVHPSLTISQFFEAVRPRGHSVYPVSDNGALRGLMSLKRAGDVPQDDRDAVKVQDVMLPAADVPVVRAATPMMDVLPLLRQGPGRAVVVEGDRIDGLISISDIAKALELEQARGTRIEPQARKAGRLVWLVVVLAMVSVVGFIYRPPLAVLAPAPALDLSRDITIDGIESERPTGKYLLVAVSVHQPSALGALYSMVDPGKDVIPISALVPRGVSERQFDRIQRQMFAESQMLAAAAAAEAAGMPVKTSGRGARILRVLPDAPAAESLRPGDVITSVDGGPIGLASDLRPVLSARPPGSTFEVKVQRGSRERTFNLRSIRLPNEAETTAGIGVLVETRDLDVDLPFEIKFRKRSNIGGPSAGLAYALAVADMIDPADLARGRAIAASGTIGLGGGVGEVGGLDQKAIAAERAGARLLLVPESEVDMIRNEDIPIRGVDTLKEAIEALRA